MPIILRSHYGRRHLSKGKGFMEITPTKQRFVEDDKTDVRVDRVRIFDEAGNFIRSFLQDKMGRRFVDNLPGTEDDLDYLKSLPPEAKG